MEQKLGVGVCFSYYFDYVYFSHEILMPVSCALHLINSHSHSFLLLLTKIGKAKANCVDEARNYYFH